MPLCRNPYLGIQTSLWYWCKSTLITRSLKEKRKGRLLQAHAKAPGWVLSRKIRHYCTDAMRVTRTLTLVHGLKNVNHAMPRPPETSWWKKTDPYPQTAKSPIQSYILLWEWTLKNDIRNVSNLKLFLPKLLMPCFVTLTASHSKVLSSMENAHIMLKTAAKCSNYAKNKGLCFSFWIMLFEADYAKNYASIMYQCLTDAQ